MVAGTGKPLSTRNFDDEVAGDVESDEDEAAHLDREIQAEASSQRARDEQVALMICSIIVLHECILMMICKWLPGEQYTSCFVATAHATTTPGIICAASQSFISIFVSCTDIVCLCVVFLFHQLRERQQERSNQAPADRAARARRAEVRLSGDWLFVSSISVFHFAFVELHSFLDSPIE